MLRQSTTSHQNARLKPRFQEGYSSINASSEGGGEDSPGTVEIKSTMRNMENLEQYLKDEGSEVAAAGSVPPPIVIRKIESIPRR